jgi:hypothetical protein
MNIQTKLTRFREIFKEKLVKMAKILRGVINKPRQVSRMLRAILD